MTVVALKACHQLLPSCTHLQMHFLQPLLLLQLLQWRWIRWRVLLQPHQRPKH